MVVLLPDMHGLYIHRNADCLILYSRKTGILVFSACLEDQSAVESMTDNLSTNGIDHQTFLGKKVNEWLHC
jgi:hypothetical protein